MCYNEVYIMEWTVDFYKDASGEEPVRVFMDSLSLTVRAKITRVIEKLVEYGVLLKEPFTKQIKGKIRELRVKDAQGNIRILYFTYTGRRFILLHGFIKKTDKTPERDIETAEKRMYDYIKRHGG
jgi:phage-related protein